MDAQEVEFHLVSLAARPDLAGLRSFRSSGLNQGPPKEESHQHSSDGEKGASLREETLV